MFIACIMKLPVWIQSNKISMSSEKILQTFLFYILNFDKKAPPFKQFLHLQSTARHAKWEEKQTKLVIRIDQCTTKRNVLNIAQYG